MRGRFPESGSLSGRLSSFGEYEECMELDSPQSSSTGLIVQVTTRMWASDVQL